MSIYLTTVDISGPPKPRTNHSTGCGESVCYHSRYYYYHVGKHIPRNKLAIVTYEGCYLGRVNGEKEHLIIAFNGQNFTVLEHCLAGEAKKALKKYSGMSCEQAIQAANKVQEQIKAELDAIPKCKCGIGRLIALDNDQRDDECYTCFLERTGKKGIKK